MASYVRAHLATVSDAELEQAWRDIEDWESTGVLPTDSIVRTIPDRVFPSEFAGRSSSLVYNLVATEIWRETARRLDRRVAELSVHLGLPREALT